jgi:hypothetical protein
MNYTSGWWMVLVMGLVLASAVAIILTMRNRRPPKDGEE